MAFWMVLVVVLGRPVNEDNAVVRNRDPAPKAIHLNVIGSYSTTTAAAPATAASGVVAVSKDDVAGCCDEISLMDTGTM